MDNTNKFTGLAQVYDASRPSYPLELIDCLYHNYGLQKDSIVADIGFGTGKFAKLLLDQGNFVYGIEPNDDMRAIAGDNLSHYPNLKIVNGTDSATGLANHSVDFITVAQAFHWFDPTAFQKECLRILKPNGKVVLIWNKRDIEDVVNQKNYEVFKKYCPNFYGFGNGKEVVNPDISPFFNGQFSKEYFSNPLLFSKEKFIQRCLSASYSLREGDEHYSNYINELANLFDTYAIKDTLTIANYTVAYIGEL